MRKRTPFETYAKAVFWLQLRQKHRVKDLKNQMTKSWNLRFQYRNCTEFLIWKWKFLNFFQALLKKSHSGILWKRTLVWAAHFVPTSDVINGDNDRSSPWAVSGGLCKWGSFFKWLLLREWLHLQKYKRTLNLFLPLVWRWWSSQGSHKWQGLVMCLVLNLTGRWEFVNLMSQQ